MKKEDIQFNIQEAKNLARKREGIVLAATLVLWLLLDIPNSIGAIIVVAGYLIVNGVLYVNTKSLKEKLKNL